MGQEQSTILNDENIDEAEARVRPRNKKVTTRKVKTVKRSAPDQFMGRVDVIDHIKPIREAPPGTKKEEIESYEGIMELAKKLNEKTKTTKVQTEELLDLEVMDLPQIGVEAEESVSESEDGAKEIDRGLYHREVSAGTEALSVFRETAHPVSIEGECTVASVLRFHDDSPFSREFPVHKIEWVDSLSVGDSTIFSIVPLSSGASDTLLLIPTDLLGKFICVKAYRRVEDQFERTKLGDAESGMYDPHITGARTTKTQPPKQANKVLLKVTESNGHLFSLYCGITPNGLDRRAVDRAVPLERDPVKAAKAKNKIPATLVVDRGMLELRYLKSYITIDQDGLIRPSGAKDQPAEPASNAIASIERSLELISVRPSKGPNTIIVALEFKAHGYKAGGTQQLIRFDVDPAVGRDLALHHCLAFQAARRARITQSTCDKWYNTGNVEAVRQMVQDFLEAEATEASEKSPAFEKMPTTPWDVLNRRE